MRLPPRPSQLTGTYRVAWVLAVALAVSACFGPGPTPTSDPTARSSPSDAAASPTPEPVPSPTIASTPTPTGTPISNTDAAAPCLQFAQGGPYLSSNGGSLTCQGNAVELTGYTFYPALLGGAKAWHSSTFHTYIDHALDMGHAAGQNLVRATDQWDSRTAGQRFDDPVVWSNMDYLVEAARQRGFFVVIDLSAYRELLVSHGANADDPANWINFIDFVAGRYRAAGNVAFYDISGEPAPPGNEGQKDALIAFYDAASRALRGVDPNHLIAAGGFNHMQDSPSLGWWQAIDSLPNIDLVAFKTYSRRDLDQLPEIAAFAASIGKPAVEDEFGMPQGFGDATFAGGSAYNGLSTGRAVFFQSVYATGRLAGVTTFIFWNMGCEVGRGSYEVSPATPAAWLAIVTNGAAGYVSRASDASLCG